MDGQSRSSARTVWADRTWILLLLALGLAPSRPGVLCDTEVTARDSITFIQYAHKLDTKPWNAVVSSEHQHPGYPVAVWLVARPLQAAADARRQNDAKPRPSSSVSSMLLLAVVMFRLGSRCGLRTSASGERSSSSFCPAADITCPTASPRSWSSSSSASATSTLLHPRRQDRRILDFALGDGCVGLAYPDPAGRPSRDRGVRRLLACLSVPGDAAWRSDPGPSP